ncbi:LtrA-domain-containing protein [Gigaspora margarita]|uniref:LtrA-domain-containing protein n=1 Tax=Gigaspora margarita TaxID=4874 RepID=A0A8H4AHH4_GIGMA|nr:LtrA-domain-containing protein [Gigaspora margarita]
MTDPQDTTKSTTKNNNVITEETINEGLPNSDEILINDEPKLNNNKTDKNVKYSKNLEIGGNKVLVVENEDQLLSGKTAPVCCVVGSPEHVKALKAKIEELQLNSAHLEQERTEALARSESVAKQLDNLVDELKELGHGSDNSDNSEQTIHATIRTFGHLHKLEIIADDDDGEGLTRKPRVRQYWHKGALHREDDERSSSYSELFWDLIFVAVVSNLGFMLTSDISVNGLQRFVLTFYPMWRLWTDTCLYLNIYSSEDLVEKFLLLWEMVLLIVMGTHASDIFSSTAAIFISSYVLARITYAFLYVIYAIYIPAFRIHLITTTWGIIIPSALWFAAIFVPQDSVVFMLWASVIFELFWYGFVPLYHRLGTKNPANHIHTRDFKIIDEPTLTMDSTKSSPPFPHKAMSTKGTEFSWKWTDMFSILKITEYRVALNIEHWSERLGLFAVICLGESIFSVIYTSLNKYPDIFLAKAILGLVIAYDLHWIYFDVDASRQYLHALRRHTFTGILFGLTHVPLDMSLIAFGSSLGRIVTLSDFPDAEHTPKPISLKEAESSHESSPESSPEFSTPLAVLFCTSLAIAMYCMATIGILHKSLDAVDCTKLSKVNNNISNNKSALSMFMVFVETYGRLKRNAPLFATKCEEYVNDIREDDEEGNIRRYIRWRWGSTNLNKRRFSTGFFRQNKTDKNEKINDYNSNNDDKVDVVVKN